MLFLNCQDVLKTVAHIPLIVKRIRVFHDIRLPYSIHIPGKLFRSLFVVLSDSLSILVSLLLIRVI